MHLGTLMQPKQSSLIPASAALVVTAARCPDRVINKHQRAELMEARAGRMLDTEISPTKPGSSLRARAKRCPLEPSKAEAYNNNEVSMGPNEPPTHISGRSLPHKQSC